MSIISIVIMLGCIAEPTFLIKVLAVPDVGFSVKLTVQNQEPDGSASFQGNDSRGTMVYVC